MNVDRMKDASKLDVVVARPDIRRDLHVLASYARDREIKRGHRDNSFSKADALRLAKLLSDPEAEAEVREAGCSSWVDFVDRFALQLGLVQYDTEGSYAGYTSQSRSFPDNYVLFDAKAYEKLASMTLARHEQFLLESLLQDNQAGDSEFYRGQVLGRLGGFSPFGSATGVMPMLDFAAIRRFLLDLLARCPVGEWLSTASLIAYLKTNKPYFLIPKIPQFKNKWGRERGRYGDFHESKHAWGNEIKINETDPDAFERVEGRYVERFLEGIPNVLGYLKAFRVSERLRRALDGKIAEPTLRVTPSFEVYVQSELYAARLFRELTPLCHLVADDTTSVFRLDRQKVAAACAADPKLDVGRLLESLSPEPLPANVRRELSDWSAHSDKFVLYSQGSLLETSGQVAAVERFRVDNVAAGIDVVRSPERLFEELEKKQLAPLRIKHGDKSFSTLPAKSRSAFASKAAAKKKRREPKSEVRLMRVTRVQLICPDREFLDRLQRLLGEANCPAEADRKKLSLAYSNRYEKDVNQAIRTLQKEFQVKIDDQ
jgi:hypothetical protein